MFLILEIIKKSWNVLRFLLSPLKFEIVHISNAFFNQPYLENLGSIVIIYIW